MDIQFLQSNFLSIFVALLTGLFIIGIIAFLAARKRHPEATPGTPRSGEKTGFNQVPVLTPTQSEVVLSQEEPPALPKKLSLSKAIASWIPLLKANSREKDKWEAALIQSDMGPRLSSELLNQLEASEEAPLPFFKRRLLEIIEAAEKNESPWREKKPWVIFLVGVNGVGKTTTVGKLGYYFQKQDLKVGVIGADTFRKAAIEQLERVCQRLGLDFFTLSGSEGSEGADPAAVVFDGLKKFGHQDIILVDTSGRLHNKKNLMEELKKMKKVAGKSLEGSPHDIWMIVDATLGQNAVSQGKSFDEAVQLTGLVITKMDGLSRGGTIFQLFQELKAPIRFIGFGEKESDLAPFRAVTFTEELFDQVDASS